MVTLKVNVEFPDGAPSTDRQHDVGISGTFNGKEWNGQYAAADENGVATLRAPKGLELAFIKTGLARHKRSADSDVEIGQAVHFKRLDEDISEVTVIKPAMARLDPRHLTRRIRRDSFEVIRGILRTGLRQI